MSQLLAAANPQVQGDLQFCRLVARGYFGFSFLLVSIFSLWSGGGVMQTTDSYPKLSLVMRLEFTSDS